MHLLDYATVVAGQQKTIELGPQEYNSAKAQGAVVVLPDLEKTTDVGAPFEGDHQYFSGNADDLDNTLTKAVDLAGAPPRRCSSRAGTPSRRSTTTSTSRFPPTAPPGRRSTAR